MKDRNSYSLTQLFAIICLGATKHVPFFWVIVHYHNASFPDHLFYERWLQCSTWQIKFFVLFLFCNFFHFAVLWFMVFEFIRINLLIHHVHALLSYWMFWWRNGILRMLQNELVQSSHSSSKRLPMQNRMDSIAEPQSGKSSSSSTTTFHYHHLVIIHRFTDKGQNNLVLHRMPSEFWDEAWMCTTYWWCTLIIHSSMNFDPFRSKTSRFLPYMAGVCATPVTKGFPYIFTNGIIEVCCRINLMSPKQHTGRNTIFHRMELFVLLMHLLHFCFVSFQSHPIQVPSPQLIVVYMSV